MKDGGVNESDADMSLLGLLLRRGTASVMLDTLLWREVATMRDAGEPFRSRGAVVGVAFDGVVMVPFP